MNVKPTNQIVLPVILYVFVQTTGCRNATVQGDNQVITPVIPTSMISISTQPDVFASMSQPPEVVAVDPSKKSVVDVGTRGCKLHIPAEAFVYEDGSPVVSPVDIKFRDFTNKSDILFSQIPMTFTENGEELCFNSAGMFEIKGECKGQKVQIARGKEIKVDYPLAQKPEGLAFYRFDEAANNWVKEQSIEKEASEPKKMEPKKPAIKEIENTGEVRVDRKIPQVVKAWISSVVLTDGVPYILNEDGTKGFLDIRMNAEYKFPRSMYDYLFANPQFYLAFQFDIDTVAGKLININPHPLNPSKEFDAGIMKYLKDLRGIKMQKQKLNYEVEYHGVARYEMIFNDYPGTNETLQLRDPQNAIAWNSGPMAPAQDLKPTQANPGIISPAFFDPGHTYPDVVRGLSVKGFGIYNCDQAFRKGNLVSIHPKFADEKGEPILTSTVVCVLQPDINSSFSFSPDQIILNA
ncbi:MAG: hypothetical protein ACKVOK_05400, partial [Flavobacteriales bacterium]